MSKIDSLLIKIDASTEGLRREMDKAVSTINNSTRRMDRSLSMVDKSFARVNAMAGNFLRTLGVLATAKLGGDLVQTLRETEVQMARLRTATGSVEAARAAFGELSDFASQVPSSISEITDSFIRLKNLGLDPSLEAIESYGNTATAMGVSVKQVIEAVADASTFQFERLLELGIKARTQGDQVSFTFQGITTTVRKNAAEITQYLRDIGDVKFAEAWRSQADTLDGALSNLGDAFTRLAIAIGDAGLTKLLAGITKWITSAAEAIPPFVQSINVLWNTMTGPMAKLNDLYAERIEIEEKIRQHDQSRNRNANRTTQDLRKQLEVIEDQIRFWEEWADAVDESAESIKGLGGALGGSSSGGGGSGAGVNKQLEDMSKALAKLEAELYPAEAATQAYRDQIQLLDDAMFAGLLTMEEHGAMVMRLAEGTAEAAESIDKTASTLSTALDESVRRLDTAFVDMWDNMLSGAKSSFDALKNLLRQTLAEMAHSAITRPIMLSIGGSLGLSGTASAAGTGSSLLGGGGIDMLSMGTSLASGAALAGLSTGWGLAAANIGAAGYLGGFGANMALAGSSLSAGAIGTAIGAAAPYLLPVLGIAALASMWSRDKTDPRVGFGDRSFVGDGAFEDGVFRTGPFSRIGYRGASHGMDAGSERWTALLDTVVAFDQALASYASGEEIARIQNFLQNAPGRNGGEAYGHGLDTSLVELDDLTDEALGALVAERMRYITAEMASLVGRSMDRFLQDFGGTIEELGTMLAALGRIDEQINTDVFERYSYDLEQASKSLVERYNDQWIAVTDLAMAYDGSLSATQQLAEANGIYQQSVYGLLAAIDAAALAVSESFGDIRQRIELDLLDAQGKYDYFTTAAEELSRAMAGMKDPQEIADAVQAVNALATQAWSGLSQEQRQAMGGDFLQTLGGIESLATENLGGLRSAVEADDKSMRDVIEAALANPAKTMDTAATNMKSAASDMMTAADRLAKAAGTPVRVVVEYPDWAEVNA